MLDQFDKKNNPFKTPDHYFEQFNADIMNQLPEKRKLVAKKVPLWKKVLPWSAAAAIFFGVILSTGILNKKTQTIGSDSNSTTNTLEQTSTEEDDYYMFLEDESIKSAYDNALYSGNQ